MHKNIIIPLRFQCGLFTNTLVSKNSIVFTNVIFYLRWYTVMHWSSHICKRSTHPSSHQIVPDSTIFGTKIFLGTYTEIYTNICFKSTSETQFLGVKKWCSAMFFLKSNRNTFAGNFAKWERFLAVLWEHIIFHVKWVKFVKSVRFFKQNYIVKCKMSDLFR